MRAWQLVHSQLIEADIPQPVPGPGEVLIRVHAAGVTPTELLWYPTTHAKAGDKRDHAVPGHEFSGTVAALGDGTTGLGIGDEVYGMSDWFADGATADFCLTKSDWVAPKPNRLTHIEAATVPIGALTAWQGLFDRAKLQHGERVLIHGGSGAVGVFAIQLAKRIGAHVITTASKGNEPFLLQLGAERVIDYRTEDFAKTVKEIDVVFDAVGGETLKRSWGVLSSKGRLVTIAADSEGTSDEKTKAAFFIVETRREQLIEVGRLLDAGELKPVVDAIVPFAQAGAAYGRKIPAGVGRGKVVVVL